MSLTLESLQETWKNVISFNSIWVRLLVVAIANGIGLFITWEMTHIYEHLFGYSSIVTYLMTLFVLLSSYFSVSYLVSSALQHQEASAK